MNILVLNLRIIPDLSIFLKQKKTSFICSKQSYQGYVKFKFLINLYLGDIKKQVKSAYLRLYTLHNMYDKLQIIYFNNFYN